MFAIPGILALFVFLYARPHEFWWALQGVPLLHVVLGLAVFGLVVDLRLRLTMRIYQRLLSWALR